MGKKKVVQGILKVEDSIIINTFKEQSEQIAKELKAHPVVTKDDFEEVSEKLKSVTNLVKEVTARKKELSKPYQDQVDAIKHAIETSITDPLTEVVKGVKEKLLVFKQSEIAEAKTEADITLQEVEEKKKQYHSIIFRLDCIRGLILAKIFGGEFTVYSTGEIKTAPKANAEGIQALIDFIDTKYPASTEFAKLDTIAIELKGIFVGALKVFYASISAGGFITELEEEELRNRTKKLIIEAEVWLQLMVGKKNSSAEIVVKEATGGNIRRTWTYELIDINLVPEEYKHVTLKEDLIDDYKKENKEELENQPIAGIRFFQTETFINK